MTEINEEPSDKESAKSRANYLARLDSEGPARVVSDQVQIAEASARLAELGLTVTPKKIT